MKQREEAKRNGDTTPPVEVMNPPADEPIKIDIPELKLALFTLTIEGDTPLVTHAWNAKVTRQMLEKQMGKAANRKEKKDPKADFMSALHLMDSPAELEDRPDGVYAKGRFGYPALGIKKAMVGAARQLDGLKMTFLRGAFRVFGSPDKINLIEIGGVPKMRQDMVRLNQSKPDIRFRPEFWPWKMKLVIQYNISVITPGQIAHLLNTAGFAGGLGENRPEKGGDWGMFHVATTSETIIARG